MSVKKLKWERYRFHFMIGIRKLWCFILQWIVRFVLMQTFRKSTVNRFCLCDFCWFHSYYWSWFTAVSITRHWWSHYFPVANHGFAGFCDCRPTTVTYLSQFRIILQPDDIYLSFLISVTFTVSNNLEKHQKKMTLPFLPLLLSDLPWPLFTSAHSIF